MKQPIIPQTEPFPLGMDIDFLKKKKSADCLNIFIFVFSAIIMSTLGTIYAVSAWGPDLKLEFNYTQSQMSTITGIGNFGGSIGGVFMGIFYDRFGARKTLLLSGLIVYGGYFALFLGAKRAIFYIPEALGAYLFIVSWGSSGGYYPALSTNLKNFSKKHHGKITGILVGMYGVSAAVVTQIYRLFFQHKDHGLDNFFLFCAFYIGGICLIGILTIRKNDFYKPRNYNKYLVPPQGQTNAKSAAIEYYGNDVSPLKLATILDFYLIFFVQFSVTGVGLTFINSLGVITNSVQNKEAYIDGALLVTVLSFCNFGGRILFGFSMDFFLKYMSHVAWYIVSIIIMLLSHLVMIYFESGFILLIGTIFIGLAYGGLQAITALVINLYFGSKHIGKNLSILSVGTAISGFALGKVFAAFFDINADKNTKECYGSKCYSTAFYIDIGICAIMIVVASILTIRSRRFRKRKDYKPLTVN